MIYRGRGNSYFNKFKYGDYVYADGVPTGCLLIHRSFLETIPHQRPQIGKSYFDWRVDMVGLQLPPDMPPLSEDFTLCVHARKHGIPTIVDTSIQCRHIGLAQSTFGQFLPCEANPNT